MSTSKEQHVPDNDPALTQVEGKFVEHRMDFSKGHSTVKNSRYKSRQIS